MAVQRIIIWIVACSLPALTREEWFAQWTSELWYVHSERASRIDTWRFTFGCLYDAVVNRREFPEEANTYVQSAGGCLLTLVLLTVVFVSFGLLLYPSRNILMAVVHSHLLKDIAFGWMETDSKHSESVHQQVVLVKLTLLISVIVTLITSGPQRFCGSEHLRCSIHSRSKCLLFSAAKLILGITLVYFAALAFSNMFVLTEITPLFQVGASLAGYIAFLRWTNNDQKRRCPICLQRLSSPVHLGRHRVLCLTGI